MKPWKSAISVLILSLSICTSASAQRLTASEYVTAMTQHLQRGGEVTQQEVQNIQSLASQSDLNVDQEAFIRLGNALYASGHQRLGEQVMSSDVIMTDRYIGATSRVWMEENTESPAAPNRSLSARDQVEGIFDDIFGNNGVDRSSAAWYANAVETGQMTLSEVEGEIQSTYDARFGNSNQQTSSNSSLRQPTAPSQQQPPSPSRQSEPRAVNTVDRVFALFNNIYGDLPVDTSSARWYAQAVDRGQMSMSDVEREIRKVYIQRTSQ